MDQTRQRVSLNFTSIFFGRGFGLVLNLFAIILAARSLGVEQYGLFTAILSTITILTKFIDFGFSPIITRELSKKPDNFSLLNNAISVRIGLFFILVIFSNIVFKLIELPFREILFSNILFSNIIFSSRFLSFRELLEIPFKVNLKMHIVVLINFLDNFLLLFLILFLPLFDDKIFYFVSIFCLANIPGFGFLIFTLYKNFRYKFEFQINRASWLLKESLPLMGYAIFISIFQQFDIVLTKNFISEMANGIYSAGLRLTLPLSIFPIALISTTLPKIIADLENKKSNSKKIILLVYKLLFIVSFISALLLSIKAEDIVLVLFGNEYLPSYKVVIILVWSNLFLFFNFFTVELLTVFHKQKNNLYFAIIIVVTDLLLFALLHEKYGYVGVAISRFIATIVGAIFLKYIISKGEYGKKILSVKLLIYSTTILIFSILISQLNIFIFFVLVIIISLILAIKFRLFNEFEMNLILSISKIQNISPKIYSYLKNSNR